VIVGFLLKGTTFQLILEVEPLLEVSGMFIDGHFIAHVHYQFKYYKPHQY